MKPIDLAIKCSCGRLGGVVRGICPDRGNHCVCYCDDCQSFAHVLGRAEEVLDANGGTEIFQTSPARVEITDGPEHLACLQLSQNGPLRWYADCCNTPIGNTARTGKLPFLGLIVHCLDNDANRESLAIALGDVRQRIHKRFATGDRAALQAHDRAPLTMFLRVAGLLLVARLRGDHRRSAFFDSSTLEPIVSPRMVDDEELHGAE